MKKKIFSIIMVTIWGSFGMAQNRSHNLNDVSFSSLKSASISAGDNLPNFNNAKRTRELHMNPVIQDTDLISVNDTILLDLFDDKQFKACIEKIDVDVNRTVTIRAKLVDFDFSYCVITTSNGKSFMTVEVPENNELYTAKYDHGSTKYYLMQVDNSKQEKLEGNPSLIPPAKNQLQNNQKKNILLNAPNQGLINNSQTANEPIIANSESTPDIVTLLIVYTPSAAEWSTANETSINNTISSIMTKSQLALDNSNTLLTMQLVHSEQVSYTELNTSSDLYNLTGQSDGYMDIVHELRDEYSADVVVLLENIEYTGGQGWLLSSTYGDPDYAFSLTRVQQASWTYTTIHEIGHNMGCHHHKAQKVQPGPGIFSYSAGWRWTGSSNAKYCSVMTYENGSYFADGITHSRVPYFSNPSIQYQNIPTGDVTEADNARTLRQTKSIVAAYRSPVYEDPNSFVANAVSEFQIDLGWVLNTNNDPVLVAWSPTNTFGIPENNSVYSVGSTIPGGGTVLYYGTSTGYNHVSLSPATTYYYKAWSDVSGTYSKGVTTSENTICSSVSSYPFSEDFTTVLQPNCWSQADNQGNGQIWQFGTIDESTDPSLTGNYAYLNSDNYGSGNTQNADLISPVFNFTNKTNIVLGFSHFFQSYSSSSATLSYSINNGASWTTIQSWTTSTANPALFSQDLTTEIAGNSEVLFKWNYTGTWAWYWAIDNILITADDVVPANSGVFSLSLGNNETICYSALENITVAGPTYSVELLSGSQATFVAGESINFLPGFHACEGSQMDAYITLTGAFCSPLPSPANEQLAEKSIGINEVKKSANTTIPEKTVRVYPNPNNGRFTVELSNFEGLSTITIANTLGAIVFQTTINNNTPPLLQLSTIMKGLYIIRVKNGDFVKTNKIIVH